MYHEYVLLMFHNHTNVTETVACVARWQSRDVASSRHEIRASRRPSCCNTVMCKLCYIHTQLLSHFAPHLVHHLRSLDPFPPVFALSVSSLFSLCFARPHCTLVSVLYWPHLVSKRIMMTWRSVLNAMDIGLSWLLSVLRLTQAYICIVLCCMVEINSIRVRHICF